MIKISEKNYITSDLHFFHANIVKYCNRSYNVKDYEDIEELNRMTEDILSEFDKLPDDCIVWNLGDLFFMGESRKKKLIENRYEEMKSIVSRMKGKNRKLYLILGNHDNLRREKETRVEFYYSLGFDKVYDTPVIINDNYILSHEPVYVNKNSNFINFYGHTHDLPIKEDYFTFDYDNYAMIKRCAKQEGLPEPELKPVYPDRIIDLNNYINACYDFNKSFLELK